MNLTATIPCITYLAKFLYWKERTELGKVISLNYVPGDAGYILAGLLTGKLSAEYFQDDELGTEFDAPVTFEISPRKFNYGRIVISEEAVRYFNAYLRKNMHEMLLDRILQARRYKTMNEKDVIYDFMQELDIQDDITFDALKKAQLRLRKRKKIPGFRPHNRKEAA